MIKTEVQPREQVPNHERVTLGDIVFGLYKPTEVITNEDIEAWHIPSKSGNLITADGVFGVLGIEKRYRAHKYESAIDMGIQAALATENLDDVDAIFTSLSYPLGRNASKEIGTRLHIPADFHLDIHAACSGFVRGFTYIKDHEEEFKGKKILFVATEKYSHTLVDLREDGVEADSSMSEFIFSDGAAAFVFTYGEDLEILAGDNKKIQGSEHYITMPINRMLMYPPYLEEPVECSTDGKFHQDGPGVYGELQKHIPELNRSVVAKADLVPQDIQLVLPHQATGRVLKKLSELMPEFNVYKDLEEGNFSSASVPKAVMRARQEGRIQPGDIVLLNGFGAGLYASSAVAKIH